ncbi:MAG: hydroxyisourate hydrolase [Pseudomonadota bacterium]
MATVSSHTLNGTDGTHAGGIDVSLTGPDGVIFQAKMDDSGRLSQEIPADQIDPDGVYELVFHTGPYWSARQIPRDGPQIMDQVVLRFRMPDPDARYHMPVILSPNGYSCWWSA